MHFIHRPTFQVFIDILLNDKKVSRILLKDYMSASEYAYFFLDMITLDLAKDIKKVKFLENKNIKSRPETFVNFLDDVGEGYWDDLTIEVATETISQKLREYVSRFEKDLLIAREDNFYSYKNHISKIESLWGEEYESTGKTLNIPLADSFLPDEKFRIAECLLSLYFKKFIKINFIFTSKNHKDRNRAFTTSTMNVTFEKSPQEITDISKYWIYYGDLRANERDGIAYYKDTMYHFKSAQTGKGFKLLCYLIKRPGEKLNITETMAHLYGKEQKRLSAKTLKVRIKEYVQEIKKHLKIHKSQKVTFSIKVIDDKIILISNPPN